MIETVDFKPTWENSLTSLLAIYQDGTPYGRTWALGELRRMAKAADAYAAERERVRQSTVLLLRQERAEAMDAWERASTKAAENYAGARAVLDQVWSNQRTMHRKVFYLREGAVLASRRAEYWRDIIAKMDAELRELEA